MEVDIPAKTVLIGEPSGFYILPDHRRLGNGVIENRRALVPSLWTHLRKKVRSVELLIEDSDLAPTQHVLSEAYTEQEELELKERFWSEFPGVRLSEEQKEVLWLYARYGFTYTEISEQLGVPSSTVGD